MSEFNVGDRVYIPVNALYQQGGGEAVIIEPRAHQFSDEYTIRYVTGANSGSVYYVKKDIPFLLNAAPQPKYVVVVTTTPYDTKEAADRYAAFFNQPDGYTAVVKEFKA